MTLTTEQLNDFAGVFRKDAARWVESGEPEIALELHALADELDALAANRDAQPVIVVGDDGGDALAYRRLIQSFAPGTKLYTAPPAPAYPERLPCPVHLLPGLKFGKGFQRAACLMLLFAGQSMRPSLTL